MPARLQTGAFDLAEELRDFGKGAGAIVTFSGVVRDDTGHMSALEIEHYPGMTEQALTNFGLEAARRFELIDWLVIHRYGKLGIGEQIMMVATASRHRSAAFEAAEYLMDWLKSRAPFWKREIMKDGSGTWVDAKESDENSLKRW